MFSHLSQYVRAISGKKKHWQSFEGKSFFSSSQNKTAKIAHKMTFFSFSRISYDNFLGFYFDSRGPLVLERNVFTLFFYKQHYYKQHFYKQREFEIGKKSSKYKATP